MEATSGELLEERISMFSQEKDRGSSSFEIEPLLHSVSVMGIYCPTRARVFQRVNVPLAWGC